MVPVIVDLSVEWQPETQLSDEAVAEQRDVIRDAQDEIVDMLKGTGFDVIRMYQGTPQIALSVDAEGLDLLRRSELVAAVSEDTPDPPTG